MPRSRFMMNETWDLTTRVPMISRVERTALFEKEMDLIIFTFPVGFQGNLIDVESRIGLERKKEIELEIRLVRDVDDTGNDEVRPLGYPSIL